MLLRALRDFNLGKLTADDTGIFMGLLNDLFPKTLELVPRAVERDFEGKVRPRRWLPPRAPPPADAGLSSRRVQIKPLLRAMPMGR